MRSYLFAALLLIGSTLLACKSSTSPSGSDDGPDTDVNGYNDKTFFKTSGTEILNRQGEPVVIRGYGLGGWLLPEGYMFNMPGDFGPTKLRSAITDLLGASEADRWFDEFRTNYVQEADIIAMKEWGADHIRVPFNHKVFYDMETETFNQDEFDRLDQVLIWCKRHRVDVILDLHGAPGGQNHSEISDSDGTARLWTEYNTYMPVVIKIWQEFARRYKDETIIIGYDLLNEPVTPDGYGANDVLRFHSDLIPEIRKIDENHILFINGNYYSTTFDRLDLLATAYDNIVYSFHKYWNETDQGSINYLISLRNQTNAPLWLGETGENSNTWFYETKELMEANNIGWNWWTHKKLNTITSPLSSSANENYNKVVEYWKGNGPRPTAQEASDGLFQMAANLAFDKTTPRPGVVAALFSPNFDAQNVPFKEHKIPGTIAASDYDIGNNGVSYYDLEYKRVSSNDNQNTGNNGWEYRNDGVDIQSSEDPEVDYNVGWIDSGEWLEFTVEVTESANYEVRARVASNNTNGRMTLAIDNTNIAPTASVPNTGGYQNWGQVLIAEAAYIEAGTHVLRVKFGAGGFNLSVIDFKKAN